MMQGYTTLDAPAIIKSFPQYCGPGQDGYVVDFLGNKTRTSYLGQFQFDASTVENYPIPEGNFAGSALEWAGVLQSVLDARDQFVAMELGAGWGPWLVSAAKAAGMRGIARCKLVGVEAAQSHLQFMHSHFTDNGLDPAKHRLIHGIVGPEDGRGKFPVLSRPDLDWGSEAVFALSGYRKVRRRIVRFLLRRGQPPRPKSPLEGVPCYSLTTLLRPFERVDLVHFDVQGAEHAVIARSHTALRQKVRRVVIGTHCRGIELHLLADLASNGWVLEAECPCGYEQKGREMFRCTDGCQIWRNPALLATPSAASPLAA